MSICPRHTLISSHALQYHRRQRVHLSHFTSQTLNRETPQSTDSVKIPIRKFKQKQKIWQLKTIYSTNAQNTDEGMGAIVNKGYGKSLAGKYGACAGNYRLVVIINALSAS